MNDPAPYFRVELDLKRIGVLLRQAREEMHLSTRELSRFAKISPTQITRMEAGEDFAVTKLVQLALPLGLQPARLIDEALVVLTEKVSAKELTPAPTLEELHPALRAVWGKSPLKITEETKGLLDFVGTCACLLLFAANPKATLDALLVPLSSLKRNLEQFLGAYGTDTEATERAAVFRSIAQAPARKLRALGLLTDEIVDEFLTTGEKADGNVQENLTSSRKGNSADSMPESSVAWLNLKERTSKVTSQRGEQARLARDLNVSRQSVNNWLTGVSSPSADLTLRLLDWVTAAEAKYKYDPALHHTKPQPHA